MTLCGVGGLGKTSLAYASVRKHFADRRAVMIALRTSSPFRQALVDLVVALGHTSQERGTTDDLAMLAIDLAEARPTVVLLDDIHNAMPDRGQ